METLQNIKTRRSIRKYKSDSVSRELLEKIVEAGIRAPSSMNRQPWRVDVVTDLTVKKTLTDEAKSELRKFLATDKAKKKWGDAVGRFMERAKSDQDFIFYDAPAAIFVVQTSDSGNDYFDYGLCTQNILLSAHELGLGCVPVGLAKPMGDSQVVRNILKMQESENLIIAIPIGYPDESPSETERDFDVVEWI